MCAQSSAAKRCAGGSKSFIWFWRLEERTQRSQRRHEDHEESNPTHLLCVLCVSFVIFVSLPLLLRFLLKITCPNDNQLLRIDVFLKHILDLAGSQVGNSLFQVGLERERPAQVFHVG